MTKEEVKLQCLNLVCHALSNRSGAIAYTENGKSNEPSTADVLEKAKLLYEWVSRKMPENFVHRELSENFLL